MRHADDLQAVSVDEALIDVSSAVARLRSASPLSADDFAVTLAQTIRNQVKQATGCEGRHIISLRHFSVYRPRSQHRYRGEHPTCPSCHAPGKARWIIPSQARRCATSPRTARYRRLAWVWSLHAPKSKGETGRDETGRADDAEQGSALRGAGKGYRRDALQGYPRHRRSETRIGQTSQIGLL